MRLSNDATLGHYEIVAPAGAVGMGEVYKARDTRLDQTAPSKGTDRPSDRFEREAHAVASLKIRMLVRHKNGRCSNAELQDPLRTHS